MFAESQDSAILEVAAGPSAGGNSLVGPHPGGGESAAESRKGASLGVVQLDAPPPLPAADRPKPGLGLCNCKKWTHPPALSPYLQASAVLIVGVGLIYITARLVEGSL